MRLTQYTTHPVVTSETYNALVDAYNATKQVVEAQEGLITALQEGIELRKQYITVLEGQNKVLNDRLDHLRVD